MLTPSGRFQPDKKICFSMSDFHPGTVCHFFLRIRMLMLTFTLPVEPGLECCYDVSPLTLSVYRHDRASVMIIYDGCGQLNYHRCSNSVDYLLTYIFRLTGLLSFMLSDEMTTGSVTSSDSHKKSFAAKSHAFNLTQHRFREAFPDVRW